MTVPPEAGFGLVPADDHCVLVVGEGVGVDDAIAALMVGVGDVEWEAVDDGAGVDVA